MTIPQIKQIINILKNKGVLFEAGLSNLEIAQIQEKFDVQFPSDLKRFLQTQLPISAKFINWRQGLTDEQYAKKIWHMLDWAWEGILLEIMEHGFWLDSWGNKPTDSEDVLKTARFYFESYPKLIPVYAHRFMPSKPNEVGNPIFSVWGLDIICYGHNLATYFAHEFYFKLNNSFALIDKPNKRIEFWSWWVDRMML